MLVTPTGLPEVMLIEPVVHGDERGFFFESYNRREYEKAGIDAVFVQDNVSRSSRGALRGLHYQFPAEQGKLVGVLEGEVFDVVVDIRAGSPSFGQWISAALSAQNHHMLWIPPGFAHGFCALSEHALFAYKCTAFYDPESEGTIRWDDPAIGIDWPLENPILSDKDAQASRLGEVAEDRLPKFTGA